MKHWYAVHTKPRQESLAEENLQRQNFTTYFPKIKQARRRRGKWSDVIEPLFPRYLFIRLEVGKTNVSSIRSTRGVTGLVRFGNKLVPVPNPFIDALIETADEQTGIHIPNRPVLEKGDRITVTNGPFADLEGIFHATTGKERVTILLNILGQAQKVTLPKNHIHPSDP
jgi:transcriptional antiterminator RfaH